MKPDHLIPLFSLSFQQIRIDRDVILLGSVFFVMCLCHLKIVSTEFRGRQDNTTLHLKKDKCDAQDETWYHFSFL